MATKSKTPAKKAVKELDIKEDTYCTFINEDGVQDVEDDVVLELCKRFKI